MGLEFAGISLTDGEVRIVATVLITAAILILYRSVYASGRWFKRRFSPHAVEAGQTLVGILITVSGLVLILDIWASSSQILGASLPSLTDTTSIQFVLTLGVLVGAYLLTRLSKEFIQAIFEGDRVSVHQREIGHHIVQVTIYGAALLFALTLWDVPLGELLIGAGAATIVIGLAARQSLGALLAGFVLLFSRPFEIGDWVVVDDQEGVVKDVNIVKTQLRTFDNEQVMIPNDKVTGSDIINRSREGQLRVTTELRLDYGADVKRAIAVAEQALADLDAEPVLDDPPPAVVVKRLQESAIILDLRVWIDEPTAGRKLAARTAVTDAVTGRFADAGIDIPFPQLELGTRADLADGGDLSGVTLVGDELVLSDEPGVSATDPARGPTPEVEDVQPDDSQAS